MTKKERVRYEMLMRVRDFGTRNQDRFPVSSTGGQAFATIAKAVEQCGEHAKAKLLTAKQGHEAMAVSRKAIYRQVRILARSARELRRTENAAADPLRRPKRLPDAGLITKARSFLDLAARRRDELDAVGLPPTCLPDLRQATDDLEAALLERRTGRGWLTAAQVGITIALAAGCRAARTLDTVVANAIEDDPVLFAEWRRHRRVVLSQRTTPTTRDEAPSAAEVKAPTTADIAMPGEVAGDPLKKAS